ncbi:hypothetical protein Tsubulata_024022, partial [Turnera subulata]
MTVRNLDSGRKDKEAILKEIHTAKIDVTQLDPSSLESTIHENTSQESNREGRVVNLSSSAHRYPYPGGIRFDKLNDESGKINVTANSLHHAPICSAAIILICRSLDVVEQIQPLHNLPEHRIRPVHPTIFGEAHGEVAAACELGDGPLVEVLPEDRLSAGPVVLHEVPAAAEEVGPHLEEFGPLEVQRLCQHPDAFLAGAQCAEVLGGPGERLRVQLHHHPPNHHLVDRDIEIHPRIGGFVLFGPLHLGRYRIIR